MEYKIGNLSLKNRVLLAPMLEPNDVAFRLLCKRAGCGLTYTGMVSPLSKQKLDLDDKPALQLFGNSVRGIKSFMKKYDSKVSLWDFNLGCPSKLSRKLGHGAFMCGDLKTIEKILRAMRANTRKPVTIKIRKSDRSLDIVRMAESYIDAVCVHARTIGQGYSGEVDYDFALKVKKAVGIPVIFSGDVDEMNIEKILEDFDFVMVGRVAIGNPSIFSKSGKKFGFDEYLKLARKYGLFFRQVKYQAMNFTKGVVGGKELRRALVGAKTIEEVEGIMGKNK
ncbi:tRNA-dihydrouridine synthase family protein [archaeon]|nr:tRNA-dihydrouridine synthase family protein [archaeon]